MAWLETDKPDNVIFYRRQGFDVVEEVVAPDPTRHPSIEAPFTTWFMRRDPLKGWG